MPPIQVHIDDEITPKKPSAVPPNTTNPQTAPAIGSATTTQQQEAPYAPARPGAAAVPAQTPYAAKPQPQPQPTRTTPLTNDGPPPPQPGAVPAPANQSAPMTASSTLPPPPRPGEAVQNQAPVTTMPAQMGMPPPQQNYTPTHSTSLYSPAERGSGPTTLNFGAAPSPQQLQTGSHPPGYQQNVNAQEMSSAERASLDAQERSHNSFGGGAGGDGAGDAAGNMWNTVKGWAAAAGNTLVETEKEVWRRVNKE